MPYLVHGARTRDHPRSCGDAPAVLSAFPHEAPAPTSRPRDRSYAAVDSRNLPGERILRLLDIPLPEGFACWTGPLLAEALPRRHPRTTKLSGHTTCFISRLRKV
jgi:hypothetical protein